MFENSRIEAAVRRGFKGFMIILLSVVLSSAFGRPGGGSEALTHPGLFYTPGKVNALKERIRTDETIRASLRAKGRPRTVKLNGRNVDVAYDQAGNRVKVQLNQR